MSLNRAKISLIEDKDGVKRIISLIPALPGCYIMKDNYERILYIGKSKSLRSRVSSYFRQKSGLSPRISLMVRQIFDIEYIITDNENEALTLESNLIKKNKPYYNILLKDDKKYPYLCITWSDSYPRIFITRRRRNRHIKDRYYGPYVDVTLLRNTLNVIKKVFPIRQRLRPLYKDKTCLNYSIGKCPGVCQELVSVEDYRETIKRISMIFQGRTEELNSILHSRMLAYSSKLEYEKANEVKLQIEGLNKLNESQKITDPDSSINRDIIAFASNEIITCVQLFQIRSGKIIGRLAFSADTSNHSPSNVIRRVIEEHYSEIDPVEIPSEIIIETSFDHIHLIEEWLSELKANKVRLYTPKRNIKARLVDLVKKNAEVELKRLSQGIEKASESLDELSILLDLPRKPRRIEGYDISHIQGSDAVGSQVVFVDGLPARHHYRKYKIKSEAIKVGYNDDYLAIGEVIKRRFRRLSNYKKEGILISDLMNHKASVFDPLIVQDFPDLVMIDGGKGQLNSALKALSELNLENDIRLCSLAKKREELFVPGQSKAISSSKEDTGLLLLRRLRDEAHRFAISFHRDRRSKGIRRSELSEIPGVGPKRIKVLLEHFQSMQAIRMASKDQLSKVEGLGNELANIIWSYFNN